ncbi:ynein regulatory complex subunit 5 [Anaeramoeba ignava]|uniref:Ynein regulatory complex subunit 5 n=1 Tax=Anaeramoeba ignava TaxID=1746090 RepID=A0A9Q0LKM5_ANAIG|nr:ynein regulatory complex subunit 5 [Anaeramoeba ignava]|eukprot:Anaeramoba_ignava/a348373_514.p1 GENE.a348373_514~~a348373_514.p1  ORF type:complete len:1383 (-),score=348.30 a348373_514:47-4195(-)
MRRRRAKPRRVPESKLPQSFNYSPQFNQLPIPTLPGIVISPTATPPRRRRKGFRYQKRTTVTSTLPKGSMGKKKTTASKRLMRDLKEINENPIPYINAQPLGDNLFIWHANIMGPPDTPWEGGIFHFTLTFTNDYPQKPPLITSLVRLKHPCALGQAVNISQAMSIALDYSKNTIDNSAEGWSPAFSISTLLLHIQTFLLEPNVDVALENLTDSSRYEEEKKNWLGSVQWAVKQSLRTKCPDPNCKHNPPSTPWPPVSSGVNIPQKSREILQKQQLRCFFTRQTFEEDAIGVGLNFIRNPRSNDISSINCFFDYLSLRAFMNMKVRESPSGGPFTHWMPLIINENNMNKAMHLAERALSLIVAGTSSRFEESFVLAVIPKLMNTMVTNVMKGSIHGSIKDLQGYCAIHHLFLAFCSKYPGIVEEARNRIENFIKNPKKREKDATPSLGDFLSLLSITGTPWEQIRDFYLEESRDRQIYWIIRKFPWIQQLELIKNGTTTKFSKNDVIEKSFEASAIGNKFLLFHIHFLKDIAHSIKPKFSVENALVQYNKNNGFPTLENEEIFVQKIKLIKNISNYDQFFSALGIEKPKDVFEYISEGLNGSREKGYHGERASLTNQDNEAKQRMEDLFSLERFIDQDNESQQEALIEDELMFRELCDQRWGLKALPQDAPQDIKFPWRHAYVQNNLQDFISKLNDNPNFALLHRLLQLSNPIIRSFEFTTFQPTNLKTRYNFLTVLLTSLTQLSTLKIIKGESAMNAKIFKALIKGLRHNSESLRTLDMWDCGIDSSALRELFDETLSGNHLEMLLIGGNGSLGNLGVSRLAKVLCRHEQFPNLRHLDISRCNIGDEGCKDVSKVLLVKRNLEVFRVAHNNISGIGLAEIVECAAYNSNMQVLDLADQRGGRITTTENLSKAFCTLFDLTISLKTLRLNKSGVAFAITKPVMDSLAKNHTLKEIDLSFCRISDSHLSAIGEMLAYNSSIEKINLKSNSITGSGLETLCTRIEQARAQFPKKVKPSALRELILDKNRLNSGGIRKLYGKIIGSKLLNILPLVHLSLVSCGLGTEAATAIGDNLAKNTNLVFLDLSNNNIGRHGVKSLCRGLLSNITLTHLDLTCNSLGSTGAAAFASVLKSNTHLQILNLYGNFIDVSGIESLEKALAENKNLHTLDLGLNRIRDRGAKILSKVLAQNSSLLTLRLKLNLIKDSGASQLAQTIASPENKCNLKFLSLASNKITQLGLVNISTILTQVSQSREFNWDMSHHIEVTHTEVLERTIYVTPLLYGVNEDHVKKLFYSHRCGVIERVVLKTHKKRHKILGSVQYAFVTFANPESVDFAMDLVHAGKAKIFGKDVKILKAGKKGKSRLNLNESTTNHKMKIDLPIGFK